MAGQSGMEMESSAFRDSQQVDSDVSGGFDCRLRHDYCDNWGAALEGETGG